MSNWRDKHAGCGLPLMLISAALWAVIISTFFFIRWII
jgi:hypothetical protein